MTAVGGEVGVEVIRTALSGVVSEVEDRQGRDDAIVAALVAVGVELVDQHLAHIVVGELLEVALDVGWGERAAASGA